jgi:hypothetical protein
VNCIQIQIQIQTYQQIQQIKNKNNFIDNRMASASSTSMASTTSTIFSKIWSAEGGFGAVALALYITCIVLTSQAVGNKDNWISIQPYIYQILACSLVGTFCLWMASIFYYVANPSGTVYFALALSCLSLGLSFSAVSISAIVKA